MLKISENKIITYGFPIYEGTQQYSDGKCLIDIKIRTNFLTEEEANKLIDELIKGNYCEITLEKID